jgi:hypothetical protein
VSHGVVVDIWSNRLGMRQSSAIKDMNMVAKESTLLGFVT